MAMTTQEMFQMIFDGVCEIFPEAEAIELAIDTRLEQLPEWDSMAAVNFQTCLLEKFDIEVPLELLADETSLEDIVAFLKSPVSSALA